MLARDAQACICAGQQAHRTIKIRETATSIRYEYGIMSVFTSLRRIGEEEV